MSNTPVHYEIHIKPPRGKWQFFGAMESRDKAIKQAKELCGGGASVQVMKETLNPADGNYLSVRIFQEGDNDSFKKTTGKTEAVDSLPCFKPTDLYSYEARKIIARLLQDSLNRWKITTLELLHSPQNLERLESTGTVLQAAVQKMAISQSQAGEGSISERVKTLHKLISDAMVMVYVDRDKKRLPGLKNTKLGALANNLAADVRREYLFNAAITAHLQDAPDWDHKLVLMLELIQDVPEDDPVTRAFCLDRIDGFVSEILSASSAVKGVVGEQPDLGSALMRLTELFCGQLAEDAAATLGVIALNKHFGLGELPEARTAIIRRVLKELEGQKRLSQETLDVEVKFLRRLATKVMIGCGNLLPHDEILSAFRVRSERLIAPDTLDTYLNEAENPAGRAERALFMSDNVVGDANKRKLGNILQAILDAPPFSQYFMSEKIPISARLQQLCELQSKVLKSELEANRKQTIADYLDTICINLIQSTNLFEKVTNGHETAVSKSLALLKLASSNILTKGKSREQAQRLALGFIRQPGALKDYLGSGAQAGAAEKMEELSSMLSEAGIDPDTVFSRSAA